ncbi:MAG: VIT1/CCC1 transporter family protein [Saprospiraceae bacterium]|nr:VIT1/CCC1 transporter family protein [Saprospiraceae bacterium]
MNKSKEIIQTESDAAYMYEQLALMQEDEQIRQFYMEMAAIEGGHRDSFLKEIGETFPTFKTPVPSTRAKILVWLAHKFGENILLSSLMDTEKSVSASSVILKKKKGERLLGNENRHVQILQSIQQMSGANLGKIEKQHRTVGGNALRAAVLGANDGLVSNMSLVMGVAGASSGGSEVVIAGTAGLLAGAISMALGEWISVKSSQELFERQIELERAEVEAHPEEEMRELILLYKAKGLDEVNARKIAEEAFKEPDKAHMILVTEELGISAEEMKSSPWEAAIASFFLFVVGAIIPLFPFFFSNGEKAIGVSVVVSTIGLFGIGAAITLITGRSFWKSGLRQVLFGLAAAAVTFGIGRLIGINLAG